MVAIELYRLSYGIWMLGIFLFDIHALASLVFSKKKWAKKIGLFVITFLFAFVWPLAVFSPEGRKILWYKIEHL